MSSSAAVLLLVCVVVCLEGHYVSGFENITHEQQIGEENSVLSQVLMELQRLTDADKKKTDEIKHLKDADRKKTDEINHLKDEDKTNKDEIKNLKDEDEKNKEEINILRDADKKKTDEINHFKGQTTNSQAAAVGSSAFMAVMDGGQQFPNYRDVILFEHVQLNLGRHYNARTSTFTCAESGLYLFSVTLFSASLRADTYDRMSGSLMVDGVEVAEILNITYDPDNFEYHQSAVTAVVECPKGGTVWVECQYHNSKVFGYANTPNSIFTGYAITYYVHP